jgi:transaldolase
VVDLVAPGTVNTMPEPTLQAVYDHAVVGGDTVRSFYDQSQQVMDQLAAVGVDMADVIATLEQEGVEKFEASWTELLDALGEQLSQA